MNPTNKDLLLSGAAQMGMSINNEQLLSFSEHIKIMLEFNRITNITAITDEREIIIKHVLDSIAILSKFDIDDGENVADIGTGAGFPGIPIKILRPDICLTLIETSKKKCEFLKEVVNKLKLENVEILNNRVEDVAKNPHYRSSFYRVVSRAVADIVVLAEYTLPLLKKNGKAIFYKSKNVEKELVDAKYAIELLGGRVDDLAGVMVPFLQAERYLLSIEKVSESPERYPRKAGIPLKRPLKQ
jgi:16S rRNA (guanine527-N7)-methyltransferase